MNLEDESLLSAYLDGELDPADRLAVEWAVESSPALAEQLRELGQARAAVVHLPRERPPRDLSNAVVARLVADRRRARLRALIRPGKIALAASGILGMAASLFLALIVLHHTSHDLPLPASLASLLGVKTPDRPNPFRPIPRVMPPVSPSVTPMIVQKSGPRPAPTPISLPRPAGPTVAEELVEAKARARVSGMVEGPRSVVRALIVSEAAEASDRVRSLLQGEARRVPDFGRIAIAQGIVVDPSWPEGADVYPVVLDERDRQPFLDRLRAAFPTVRVEGQVADDLLTQLTEVGGVAIFRGVEAAPLGKPPVGLPQFIAAMDLPPHSLFAEPAVIDHQDQARPAGVPAREAGRPGPEPTRPPSILAPPGLEPAPGAGAEPGSLTVLIWVTHPPGR